MADAEQIRLRELRRAERDLRISRQSEISRAARQRQISLVRELKAQMEFERSAYKDEIAESKVGAC
jgi:hypothetical protein